MTTETQQEPKRDIQVFNDIILQILNVHKKGADRENNILLALTYDNFEEYYEENKHHHILRFSNIKRKFGAVIRQFMFIQLRGFMNSFNWDEQKTLDYLYEAIEANIDSYMEILKRKYPKVFKDIKERNETALGFSL